MMVRLESGEFVNSQYIRRLFITEEKMGGCFEDRSYGYQIWIGLFEDDGRLPLGRPYKTRDDAQKAMDDFVHTVFGQYSFCRRY